MIDATSFWQSLDKGLGNTYAINKTSHRKLKQEKKNSLISSLHSVIYTNLVGIIVYTVIIKFNGLLKIDTAIHPQSF